MVFTKNMVACLLLAISLMYITGCQTKNKEKYSDTDMYDISSPKVISLPQVLDEISGIAYYPKDTSIFGIIDEDGLLYKVSLNNPGTVKYWPFDKKRDYEELALVDSIFYVLVSNGDIVSIRFIGDSIYTDKSDYSDAKKEVTEFESMIVKGDSMIIICKECEEDDKEFFSSFIYSFKDSAKIYKPYVKFNVADLVSKAGLDGHFKASAAALNPVTNEIFIISSVSKLLLITSLDGKIKQFIKLDPKLYKQPEGLAFTPEGHLIISNEFAEVGFANLLLMKNKKAK